MIRIGYIQFVQRISESSDSIQILLWGDSSVPSHRNYLWDSISPTRLSVGQKLNIDISGPISLVESSIPAKILEKDKTVPEPWHSVFISRLFYVAARLK